MRINVIVKVKQRVSSDTLPTIVNMEGLENYTIEELKAEIKRRNDLAKKEAESVMRCKHCSHFLDKGYGVYRCGIKTWGKKIRYNYTVSKSQRACELFEQKENDTNR